MVGGLSENLPLPTGGDANLQNGTEDLFINSLKVNNLTENLPLKVDSDKDVFSTLLNISDVSGLQTALDDTISTPHIGTIQATDFRSDNILSYDTTVSDLQTASTDAVYKSVLTTQALLGDLNLPSGIGNVNVGAELGLVITQANGNTASLLTKVSKTETDTQNMNGSLKITSTTPSLELKNTLANPSSGTIRFTDLLDNPKATIKLKSDGGIEVLNDTDPLFRINPTTLFTECYTNFLVNNNTQPDTNIVYSASNGQLNNYYETTNAIYSHSVINADKSFQLGNSVRGTIYQYDYNNDRFNFLKKVLSNQTLPADFTNPNELVSKAYVDNKDGVLQGQITTNANNISNVIAQTNANTGEITTLQDKTVNIDAVGTIAGNTKLNGVLDVVGSYKSNGQDGILAITSNGGTGTLTLCENSLPLLTGGLNTVIGNEAGIGLTSGTENTIIGYQAGQGVNTRNTVCIGYLSGLHTTGANNTFIGTNAGRGVVGSNALCNIAIGSNALLEITFGLQNIAMGCNAAKTLTDGDFNVGLGDSCVLQPALSNQIAVGYQATTTLANQCVIGNTSLAQFQSNGFRDLDVKTSNILAIGKLMASAVEIGKVGAINTLKGNTKTGLLTVKRDDGAVASANTFEIKNASDTQIYAIDGLGHNIGNNLIIKTPSDGSYINIRSQTSGTVRGIYNNYGGVERPVLVWNNTSTVNTSTVLMYSNNAEMLRMMTNTDATTRTIILRGTTTTLEGAVLIPGTINTLTPVGGKLSFIASETVTNRTDERGLINFGDYVGAAQYGSGTFAVGDTHNIRMSGVIKTHGSQDLTLRIKIGSLVIPLALEGINAAADTPVDLDFRFTIRTIGSAIVGSLKYRGVMYIGDDRFTIKHLATVPFNTIANQLLNITIQWVVAHPDNIFTAELLNTYKIY